jgi:hypothetical protein
VQEAVGDCLDDLGVGPRGGAGQPRFPPKGGKSVAQAGHVIGELRTDEGDGGAGVVEHMGQIVRGETEVDHCACRADQWRRLRQLQAGGMVLVDDGDPDTSLHSGRAYGRRGTADSPVLLTPGPFLVAERQRPPLGSLCQPALDNAADARQVSGHGTSH